MKRSLAMLLILLLVLGSFPVAEEEAPTYGEILFDWELILGDGEGDLMEGEALTRSQMMVVLARMYGLEEEAASFELPTTFSDVDPLSAYAPYIAFAEAQGWVTGYGDGTFGPHDSLTADQAATMLLRVLGYSSEEDFTFEEAVAFAASLGIDVTAGITDDGAILRGELFELMYKTLKTENTEGDLLSVVLGLEEGTPETLEVLSVEALNLVQVAVVFNTEVDEETAEEASNYSVESDDDTFDIFLADLQEDGVTVILNLDLEDEDVPVAQQTEAVVSVEDVEALDNEDLLVADTEMTVAFMDTTIPEVTGATNTGINTFKVTFSEPMDFEDLGDKDNYEVKNEAGKKYYLSGDVALLEDNQAVRITTFNDLSEGDYTLEVSGIADYAGFTVLTRTFTVTVEEDAEAPYVTGYKDADAKGVTLIWNEDLDFENVTVKAMLSDGIEEVYHTNSSNEAKSIEVIDNEMTILFSLDNEGDLLPEGTAYVYVLEEYVQDYWENDNAQQMIEIEVTVDTAPPAIEDVEVEDDELTITFTEAIAFDEEEFTFLDDEGEEVDVDVDSEDIDEDKLIIGVAGLDGDYTLTMAGIVDTSPAANAMAETTVAFTVTDAEAPFEADYPTARLYFAEEEGQLIRIDFGEAMATEGEYSVTDLSNYIINTSIGAPASLAGYSPIFQATGSAITGLDFYQAYELTELKDDFEIDIEIVVLEGGEAVEIHIPSVVDDGRYGLDLKVQELGAGYVDYTTYRYLELGRLADAEGNLTEAFSTFVEIEPKGIVAIDTVHAIATDTVEVTLEDRLTEIEGEDFSFYVGDLEPNEVGSLDLLTSLTFGEDFGLDTYENEDDNTVLVFEFFEEVMNYDATYGAEVADAIASYDRLYFVVTDEAVSANAYGEPVDFEVSLLGAAGIRLAWWKTASCRN